MRVNLRWCLIMLWLILHGSSHLTINIFLLTCIVSLGPISQVVLLGMLVCVRSPHTQQIRTHSVTLCEWQQRDSRRIKENDGRPLSFLSEAGKVEAAGKSRHNGAVLTYPFQKVILCLIVTFTYSLPCFFNNLLAPSTFKNKKTKKNTVYFSKHNFLLQVAKKTGTDSTVYRHMDYIYTYISCYRSRYSLKGFFFFK